MGLIPPRKLCLSGGGIRVVACVGALEVLEEKGLLKQVTEYIGISAGALLGFCLSIGYTVAELKRLCLEFDFTLIREFEPETALMFLDLYGLDSGEKLVRLLETLLRVQRLPVDLTFQGLADKNPKALLRCYATDLHTCRQREFSLQATPRIKLVEALRASMGMTFYYTPVADPVTGNLLTDGAMITNYPMAYLTEEERQQTIGLAFSTAHTKKEEISDFIGFFQQILACTFVPTAERVQAETASNTILLPNGDFPSWKFEATKEERQGLMTGAREAAIDFLEKRVFAKQIPVRRWSVA
jgi:NTE family protein